MNMAEEFRKPHALVKILENSHQNNFSMNSKYVMKERLCPTFLPHYYLTLHYWKVPYVLKGVL